MMPSYIEEGDGGISDLFSLPTSALIIPEPFEVIYAEQSAPLAIDLSVRAQQRS